MSVALVLSLMSSNKSLMSVKKVIFRESEPAKTIPMTMPTHDILERSNPMSTDYDILSDNEKNIAKV
ncbi:hypothetical protein ASPCADRAFT_7563 [Aspergillus carbonarius ITEM 5010]|uniref:Uncharacterized protein n=1 Tax=Aspergillus carbonarius (strain ITEM 5010) TaxID=602072 RepID=A0A1R3RFR5_ASPC5|nr:hypothetical protein ASPCADRAFT_7563 [Aspergillus carbonarius ITEM 5010]